MSGSEENNFYKFEKNQGQVRIYENGINSKDIIIVYDLTQVQLVQEDFDLVIHFP